MTDANSDDGAAEIDARMQVSLLRSSRPLSDEERALVRERTKRLLAAARALRSVPLENRDEPELGFAPGRPANPGEMEPGS